MGRHGVLALALVACGLTGCKETFECAADSHCQLDGVAGFCESLGHCSFPDEDCETGRRFGDLAGTLSNMCVPPGDAVTSGEVASTGDGSASGSTTVPDPTTATASGSSSTGSDDASSSGSAQPTDCNILFEDTFEGNMLGETWSVLGEPPTVSSGALRFTIEPENVGAYPSASVLSGTPLNLSDGWVTVRLDAVPQLLRTQGTITLDFGEPEAMALYEAGGMSAMYDSERLEDTATTAPWIRIALESSPEGTDIAYYESEDADAWTEVARLSGIPADPTSVRVSVRAGAYQDFAIPQEFAIRSLSVCGRNGL
ncbi:MAG: hypothetical protein ACE37F_17475 [Nannocystaceae bacterium]|nr:hypothetical protein [bacterium]